MTFIQNRPLYTANKTWMIYGTMDASPTMASLRKTVAATMEVTNPWDLGVQILDVEETQQTYSSSSVNLPDYGKEDPT